MEAFYTYAYGSLTPLALIAIGLSIASFVSANKRNRKLARKFAVTAVVLNVVLAGIFLTSFVYLFGWHDIVRWRDLVLSALWSGIAFWNYRKSSR